MRMNSGRKYGYYYYFCEMIREAVAAGGRHTASHKIMVLCMGHGFQYIDGHIYEIM
jgi:predicted lactoylglutathione lyase